MNNFEKIKNMTLDEMAEEIAGLNYCNCCVCRFQSKKCQKTFCHDGIKQWLQQESEG